MPASANAVSASCHVKPSKARRALAYPAPSRAQLGRRCARRTSRPSKRYSWYHSHLRLAPIKVKRWVLIIVQNLPVPFDRRVAGEPGVRFGGLAVRRRVPHRQWRPRPRGHRHGGTVQIPATRAGADQVQLRHRVPLLVSRDHLDRAADRRSGRFAVIQACNPPVIFWPFAMAFRALEGTRFVFDHHDLRPGLYGFRFPAGPRLPYHGSRAFERRTHRAAGYVISTNDSCREIAMRPRVGQDKGRASRADPIRRGHPDRCADAHPCRVPRRHHPGDDRGGREPVEWQLGAGMNASSASQLGWYARRVARMSPAEVAWRARDRVLQAAWSRRQVTQEQLARVGSPMTGERRFGAVLPREAASRVPEDAKAAVLASADRLLRGEWEVLGVVRTDMVRPDWFRDPLTGHRSAPGRYAFRIDHRSQAQVGNVKQVWEISRLQHLTLLATAWFLTHEEKYAQSGR